MPDDGIVQIVDTTFNFTGAVGDTITLYKYGIYADVPEDLGKEDEGSTDESTTDESRPPTNPRLRTNPRPLTSPSLREESTKPVESTTESSRPL